MAKLKNKLTTAISFEVNKDDGSVESVNLGRRETTQSSFSTSEIENSPQVQKHLSRRRLQEIS